MANKVLDETITNLNGYITMLRQSPASTICCEEIEAVQPQPQDDQFHRQTIRDMKALAATVGNTQKHLISTLQQLNEKIDALGRRFM